MTKNIAAATIFTSALMIAAALPASSKPVGLHFTPANHQPIKQAGGTGVRPPVQSNAVVITSFTAGFADPNGVIPNFDLVPGAGVDNWDVSLPVAVLHIGNVYNYSMTFHSVNFAGLCQASYKLTQGSTVLDSAKIVKKFDCTSPSIWAYDVNGKTIPNSPGPAVLEGTLQFGTDKSTVKVPMLIK